MAALETRSVARATSRFERLTSKGDANSLSAAAGVVYAETHGAITPSNCAEAEPRSPLSSFRGWLLSPLIERVAGIICELGIQARVLPLVRTYRQLRRNFAVSSVPALVHSALRHLELPEESSVL